MVPCSSDDQGRGQSFYELMYRSDQNIKEEEQRYCTSYRNTGSYVRNLGLSERTTIGMQTTRRFSKICCDTK